MQEVLEEALCSWWGAEGIVRTQLALGSSHSSSLAVFDRAAIYAHVLWKFIPTGLFERSCLCIFQPEGQVQVHPVGSGV